MSSHRHLNETLFNVLFTAISLSLHMVLMHSRASSRTAVIISCIEAAEKQQQRFTFAEPFAEEQNAQWFF
jgi:hypothetical protein